jgi:hypothetical protein
VLLPDKTLYEEETKNFKVSTSQLGRNKYYFSTKYQKKLVRNYKKDQIELLIIAYKFQSIVSEIYSLGQFL